MRVTPADLLLLPQAALDRFQRHAQIEHNRAAPNSPEREKWQAAWRAANAEQVRRVSSRSTPSTSLSSAASEGRRAPSGPPEEEPLADRVQAAKTALYGPERTLAQEEAARLLPEMQRAH